MFQRLFREGKAQIFATDTVLTTLMCAQRSVYSWDLVLTKRNGCIFIDKRDGSAVDLLTSGETNTAEPVPEDREAINALPNLSYEATAINQNWSQQALLKGKTHSLGSSNPFAAGTDGEIASVGYRYRSFALGQSRIAVRCEVGAITEIRGEQQLMHLRAFNEWDPKNGSEWKTKLESQRGAILATEIKNNAAKVAKWTAQALLSGKGAAG